MSVYGLLTFADETWLRLRKEWDHLVATQLLDENNLMLLIEAVHLEDVLGEIDTDGLNLLQVDALSNDPH